MNKIEWKLKAIKQLKKIPQKDKKNILEAVDELEKFPNLTNIKALKNHDYEYRLRIGNYRVLFNYKEIIEIIVVEEVKKRDENTY